MRRPPPTPPRGAPEGTVWFGGSIEWFSISLGFYGEKLDPDDVTDAMSLTPSRAWRVGDRPALKSGHWSRAIRRSDTDEWDVDEAIRTLLGEFPEGEAAWARVSGLERRLLIGLALTSSNQGLSLAPDVAAWLGRRNVRLDIDIYREESET